MNGGIEIGDKIVYGLRQSFDDLESSPNFCEDSALPLSVSLLRDSVVNNPGGMNPNTPLRGIIKRNSNSSVISIQQEYLSGKGPNIRRRSFSDINSMKEDKVRKHTLTPHRNGKSSVEPVPVSLVIGATYTIQVNN